MTSVSNFRALISDYRLNGMTSKGTPVFVTYSFLTNAEVPSLGEYQPYSNDGYSAFNATQKANFRKGLDDLARVSGVRFVEVDDPNDATMQVMKTSGSLWAGWANYGIGTRDFTSQGYMVIDSGGSFAPGTYAYETILHELGHVAGLKHPFEGDPVLVDRLDQEDHTLMSYNSNYENDTNYAHLDIDALQFLYGRSGAVKDAWNWWFNDNKHRFFLEGSMKADQLIGTNTDSTISGRGGNDKIFGRDADDKALGQDGDDRFMLGMGDNRALGGGGNDTFLNYWGNDVFDGGRGKDTVSFVYATWAVFVDLGDETVQYTLGNDRFINVENAIGSSQGDQITGSGKRNVLSGRDGADVLLGAGGNDLLLGGKQNDELNGGTGRDVLAGGDGNDILFGGAGADVFRFRANAESDQVTDYVDGEDMLEFLGFGFGNRAQARAQFYEIGTADDDVVGFSYSGTTVTIYGADLGDINRADLLV